MKTILIITTFITFNFNAVEQDRDCEAEASRIYDFAIYQGATPAQAFIRSSRWRSSCNLDNSTGQITAPNIGE